MPHDHSDDRAAKRPRLTDDDDAETTGAASPPSTPSSYRVNGFFTNGACPSTTSCRSLMELHLLQSVGAVLDKPQWWLTWQQRPEVRAKWLEEIDRLFVERTFASILKWWPTATNRCGLLQAVRAAVTAEPNEHRQRLLDDVCASVEYKTQWLEEDEADDREEPEATWSEDDDKYAAALQRLRERGVDVEDTEAFQLPKLDPYGQLGWYIHQWTRIQRVRAVGSEALTFEDVEGIFGRDGDLLERSQREYEDPNDYGDVQDRVELVRADQRDAQAAADVVFALRGDGELTLDTVRDAIGNADESREDVLMQLLQSAAMIHVELDEVRAFITAYVDTVLHRCRLRLCDIEKGRNRDGITWGPVEDTFLSDGLISQEVKSKFVGELRALEDVPADQLDWHPRANEQVLDLVHPSLFCGVYDVTKRVPPRSPAIPDAQDLKSQLLTLLVRSEDEGEPLKAPALSKNSAEWLPPGLRKIKFQWLPSEFEISESGDTCHIRSYINNLHPSDHKDLYQSIEQIFARFVPLFENVLASLKAPTVNVLIPTECEEREHSAELPLRPSIPTDVEVNRVNMPRESLAGKTLQVIVKIAEIVLTPEKPTYGGGAWHVEGTAAEQIVATGIYYCTNDNITDSQLGFRTIVDSPDYVQQDHLGVGVTFGLTDHQALMQSLGAVTTREDRCLVFPNTLQHKVHPFELVDKTKRGVRKILCFFLINPSRRIPSTAEIAPQQREWIKRAQQEQLQQTSLQSDVPEIVQQQILETAYSQGMTLEQAKAYRLELMDERSPDNVFLDNDEWMFSLCEH